MVEHYYTGDRMIHKNGDPTDFSSHLIVTATEYKSYGTWVHCTNARWDGTGRFNVQDLKRVRADDKAMLDGLFQLLSQPNRAVQVVKWRDDKRYDVMCVDTKRDVVVMHSVDINMIEALHWVLKVKNFV